MVTGKLQGYHRDVQIVSNFTRRICTTIKTISKKEEYMELEYIPDGSQRCPLIILSPSVTTKAEQLYKAIQDVILGSGETLDIHTLPFITPVDGCRLSAQVSDEDIGAVLLEKTKNYFTWKLTRQSWEFALELLQVFTEPDCSGYQYLDDTLAVSVIISTYYRQW